MILKRLAPVFAWLMLLSPVYGVDIVGGTNIPDAWVRRNHPEAKNAMPINQTLWRMGWEKMTNQCNFLDENLQPTKTTATGAAAVSLNIFPPSLIDSRADKTGLLLAHGNMPLVAQWFANYALKISDGDLARAVEVVAAAEKHDAYCVGREIQEVRARSRLLQDGLIMTFAARDGAPVIWKSQLPLAKAKVLETESLERHMRSAEAVTAENAKAYEMVYAYLRAADTRPAKPSPPREEAVVIKAAVTTIQTERIGLAEQLRTLKAACLLQARC